MTGRELAVALAGLELAAAPGTLLAIDADDQPILFVDRDRGGDSGLKEANSVEALLKLGALVEGAAPNCGERWGPFVQDWNLGWPPESAQPALLLSLSHALALPPELGGSDRRRAVFKFLAAIPPVLAKTLLDAASGSARILALAPSLELAAEIEELAPSRVHGGPWLLRAGRGWEACPLDAAVGPLAPATSLRVFGAGAQQVAISSVLSPPSGIGLPPGSAAGIREDREEAELTATAEAHERHAAGVISRDDLEAGSFRDLDAAISPDAFVSYAPWQYGRHADLLPFDEDEVRLWARVKDLGGRRRLVLADLVFYPFGGTENRFHTAANSSGMAAHRTSDTALRGAWAELIERDAFMRHWLGRIPGRQVRLRHADDEYRRMHEDLHDAGWSVGLVQLGGSPHLPVLCAIVRRRGMVALGAAAGDPGPASVKALREAWAGVRVVREREEVPEVEEVRSPSDHRRLYRWGGFAGELDFFFDGNETTTLEQLHHLDGPPVEAVAYRWPARLVRPFFVVRVLHPWLIPITFGYRREPLGRADVRSLLLRRGSDGSDLIPHPFP